MSSFACLIISFLGCATLSTSQPVSGDIQPLATENGVSYYPSIKPPKITTAINQKNLTTFAVSTVFRQQFTSVQSCLPVSLGFVTANNASVTTYGFKVNGTSLRDAYNLLPFVKHGVLSLALNGTLRSNDLVNVTVTVPDALATTITNVTAAGSSYVSFAFNNVTGVDTFQAQIPGTGVVNLVHNPTTLLVYASTNGSALLDGKLRNVRINYASTQPVIVTNAEQLSLAKTGSGSVFIGNVSDLATITMTGIGAVSANSTGSLNLVQQGQGSVLASVVVAANITFAGAGNQTRINGLGTTNKPTIVDFFNSGNGTVVFTGNVVANGLTAPLLPSCINITNFASVACIPDNVVAIAENPEFPIKRPRCKGANSVATWILSDSEKCFKRSAAKGNAGFSCETVPPVNGGFKFLFLLGLLIVGGLMVFVNGR